MHHGLIDKLHKKRKAISQKKKSIDSSIRNVSIDLLRCSDTLLMYANQVNYNAISSQRVERAKSSGGKSGGKSGVNYSNHLVTPFF